MPMIDTSIEASRWKHFFWLGNTLLKLLVCHPVLSSCQWPKWYPQKAGLSGDMKFQGLNLMNSFKLSHYLLLMAQRPSLDIDRQTSLLHAVGTMFHVAVYPSWCLLAGKLRWKSVKFELVPKQPFWSRSETRQLDIEPFQHYKREEQFISHFALKESKRWAGNVRNVRKLNLRQLGRPSIASDRQSDQRWKLWFTSFYLRQWLLWHVIKDSIQIDPLSNDSKERQQVTQLDLTKSFSKSDGLMATMSLSQMGLANNHYAGGWGREHRKH